MYECVVYCTAYIRCMVYTVHIWRITCMLFTYSALSYYLCIYLYAGGDADRHRLPSGAADIRQGRDSLRGG